MTSGFLTFPCNNEEELNQSLNNIGIRTSKTATSISIPSSFTIKEACRLSLNAGIYIIDATLRFPSNANGIRLLCIGQLSIGITSSEIINQPACNGDITYMHASKVINLLNDDSIMLGAVQTSGSTLTIAYASLFVTRIK